VMVIFIILAERGPMRKGERDRDQGSGIKKEKSANAAPENWAWGPMTEN